MPAVLPRLAVATGFALAKSAVMLSVSPLASAAEREHKVQVANDVASAKKLPSREARPGRRVNNSAAGKLQGGELREDCVKGALESCWRRVWRSWRMRPAALRRLLERRDAGVGNALRQRAWWEAQQRICYFGVYLQWRVPTVESREASALASALPRRAASRAAVVTAFRRAAAILESTSEKRVRLPWRPTFNVLEGVVATKTPDGVDLTLSNYSTTAAMNGSIASANNATLATAANYGLKTVVDRTPRWPTLFWGPSPPLRWPPSS